MALLGYIAAIVIGVLLGLMGGGGSVLTVPVLVYLFGRSGRAATVESLFIVGVTAAMGALVMARRGQVDVRAAVRFALPSLVAVWLARAVVLPALPGRIGPVERDTLLLVLFAVVMLATAVAMLGAPREATGPAPPPGGVALSALLVGALTGLAGAGGGFLIVPALTLTARLPIKTAVGTSLAIIAANSLFGFFIDPAARVGGSWPFRLALTALSAAGMAMGTLLSRRVPGYRLRPGFGVFLLVMGAWMVGRELLVRNGLRP